MTDSSNYYLSDSDERMLEEHSRRRHKEKKRQTALYEIERSEVKPIEPYNSNPSWGFGSCLVEFRGEIYEVTEKWLNRVNEYSNSSDFEGEPLSERKSGHFSDETKAHLLRILGEEEK